MKLKLTDLTPLEIAQALNLEPFRGKQIFQWIYRKRVFDLDAMSDLPKDLRQRLRDKCILPQLTLDRVVEAPRPDGTRKALFRLEDGDTVESVLIRDRDRVTLCLSTQVGCAVKCAFCATGLAGYTRDLSPGEIVEQALFLLAEEPPDFRTPNIVYMGMGEPFRNYDATVKSIRLLMAKEGLGIGARRITVSTAGDVPGIARFAQEGWQVRLSISLHAANDALRSQLVPLNRKYPLRQLMKAVQDYVKTAGRHITFEWVLFEGANDSFKDAEELVDLLKPLKAETTVNLIPYNPVEGSGFATPDWGRCEAFREALARRGINCTLRKERGRSINAACGQLRRACSAKPRQTSGAAGVD